jgi:hypothetical protein
VCVCGRREHAIELMADYPIHEVTEVRTDEDGDGTLTVLDSAAYRLDEHARLVRVDGLSWPLCWRTMEIDMVVGKEPPIEAQMAAAELACSLLKACNGEKCGLPAHVRSVTRRGVEHDVWDVVALLQAGMTGLPLVDHFLSVHGGPCRRSRMYDPLRDRQATRVG